jgi:hypothetical protein
VGKNALPVLFHLLKKLTEPDEYIDSLELILKLVKSKANSTAKMNTQVILEEMAHMEFLLDLLDHEEILIAVMASEILTNMHSLLRAMISSKPFKIVRLGLPNY